MKNPWHVAWQTSPLQRVWPMVHQPRSPGRWARERPMQWVAHQIELKMQQVFWESHPASTTPHRYHPTWYFSQWWPILHQVPGAPWKKCNTECAKATAAVSRFLCWQATSLAEKRAATLASQKLSGRWPKPFGAKRCWWELIARSLDWKICLIFKTQIIPNPSLPPWCKWLLQGNTWQLWPPWYLYITLWRWQIWPHKSSEIFNINTCNPETQILQMLAEKQLKHSDLNGKGGAPLPTLLTKQGWSLPSQVRLTAARYPIDPSFPLPDEIYHHM